MGGCVDFGENIWEKCKFEMGFMVIPARARCVCVNTLNNSDWLKSRCKREKLPQSEIIFLSSFSLRYANSVHCAGLEFQGPGIIPDQNLT